MNEHILEIRYLVDDLGDVDIDEELELPLRVPCFEYLIKIQLASHFLETQGSSSISIIHDEKLLSTRALSSYECRLILEVVSTIKFSFDGSEHLESHHPYDSYCVKLKRGTALMSFAWSDNDHITTDVELRSTLMKLVILIGDLKPIDYESFGFESPMKE
jgi:hypothetical protein